MLSDQDQRKHQQMLSSDSVSQIVYSTFYDLFPAQPTCDFNYAPLLEIVQFNESSPNFTHHFIEILILNFILVLFSVLSIASSGILSGRIRKRISCFKVKDYDFYKSKSEKNTESVLEILIAGTDETLQSDKPDKTKLCDHNGDLRSISVSRLPVPKAKGWKTVLNLPQLKIEHQKARRKIYSNHSKPISAYQRYFTLLRSVKNENVEDYENKELNDKKFIKHFFRLNTPTAGLEKHKLDSTLIFNDIKTPHQSAIDLLRRAARDAPKRNNVFQN